MSDPYKPSGFQMEGLGSAVVEPEQKIAVKSGAELNDEFQRLFKNMELAPVRESLVRNSPQPSELTRTAYTDLLMGQVEMMEKQLKEGGEGEVTPRQRLRALPLPTSAIDAMPLDVTI